MSKEKISDFTLERYLLKELPGSKMKEIQRLLKTESGLKSRLEKLQASDGDILKKHPIEEIVPEISRRYNIEKAAGTKPESNRISILKRFLYPSFVFAAAAVIFVIILLIKNNFYDTDSITLREKIQIAKVDENNFKKGQYNTDTIETIRLKGSEARLYVYRKANNKVELLKNGSKIKKGDLIQLAFVLRENYYGIVFSIDGRGTVTLHFPGNDGASSQIRTSKKFVLPNAYELDDAPGYERFFLVSSKSKFYVKDVLTAAGKMAENPKRASKENLKLKKSMKQMSIMLIKGE